MVATATEVQNNFGKYINLAAEQEIIITRNGSPIARLLGMNETVSFLSDRLVGLVPADVDEKSARAESLACQ